MDANLDNEFRSWLGQLAIDWLIPEADVPRRLGPKEIDNRLKAYPVLGRVLARIPIDIQELADAARACWTLLEQFDAIRLNEFLKHPESVVAVTTLISDFPADETSAAGRIDAFIELCRTLGSGGAKSSGLSASSAALLASTILTAALPKRFVDFRQTRWKEFADSIGYPNLPAEKPTYGEMIVWAGKFAKAIAKTETFQRHWPAGEPLWTIAGICWEKRNLPTVYGPDAADRYHYEEDFEEGWEVLRPHLVRERNSSLIDRAKALWSAADPLLRCDICRFSFLEAYGELGRQFIEAPHKQPLQSIKAGAKAKIEDLAKVCANCHRMLHVGQVSRPIEELRAVIKRGDRALAGPIAENALRGNSVRMTDGSPSDYLKPQSEKYDMPEIDME